MRVAIIGTRNIQNIDSGSIAAYLPEACSEIISGGAPGIDTLAEELADRLGLPFVKLVPRYERYGRLAPFKRNEQIVERADLVLAFWDFVSRGTADAIARCIESGTQVKVIGLDEIQK